MLGTAPEGACVICKGSVSSAAISDVVLGRWGCVSDCPRLHQARGRRLLGHYPRDVCNQAKCSACCFAAPREMGAGKSLAISHKKQVQVLTGNPLFYLDHIQPGGYPSGTKRMCASALTRDRKPDHMCLTTLSAYGLDHTHPDTHRVRKASALLLLLEAGLLRGHIA